MIYLKKFKLFESKSDLVNTYLQRLNSNRQYIIDIFQGIVDLGYEPKFNLNYLDDSGKLKNHKNSAKETPILSIKFESNHEKYIGGSINFNNLDYIENLYYGLSMFMSMYKEEYKDICDITYSLDNMIELKISISFDTEYDESKVSVSNSELYKLLKDCSEETFGTDTIEEYSIIIDDDRSNIFLEAKPKRKLILNLFDKITELLKKGERITSIDNNDDIEEMGKKLGNAMAKKLSKDLSKDIRYIDNIPGGYHDKEGNGLWLFIDNKRTQMIVKITSIGDSGRTIKYTVKLGFMNSKNIQVTVHNLEFILHT